MIHDGGKTRFREEHAEQPMKKSRKDTKGIVVDACFSSNGNIGKQALPFQSEFVFGIFPRRTKLSLVALHTFPGRRTTNRFASSPLRPRYQTNHTARQEHRNNDACRERRSIYCVADDAGTFSKKRRDFVRIHDQRFCPAANLWDEASLSVGLVTLYHRKPIGRTPLKVAPLRSSFACPAFSSWHEILRKYMLVG
jgi:hypothetical protein